MPVSPKTVLKVDVRHPQEQGLKPHEIVVERALTQVDVRHPQEQGLKPELDVNVQPGVERGRRPSSTRTRIETYHAIARSDVTIKVDVRHPQEQGLKLLEGVGVALRGRLSTSVIHKNKD